MTYISFLNHIKSLINIKPDFNYNQYQNRILENLGFVVGGTVTVVSEIGGNMIVNVKDSRVAIGKDMANKIMV